MLPCLHSLEQMATAASLHLSVSVCPLQQACPAPQQRAPRPSSHLHNTCLPHTTEIWTTPELFRADVFYSGTPFAGGPTPPGWIGPTEFGILRNTTSGETWQWYPLPGTGQTYCSKGTDNSPSALCIGGDLTLNATHTVGGIPSYTWVGFEDRGPEQEACWHSLLINSKEATDPARWVSATSQCVSQKGSGGLYPSSNVQTLAFSDFSTEPFAPGVFDLPAACQKL